jgi:hypothetical protein
VSLKIQQPLCNSQPVNRLCSQSSVPPAHRCMRSGRLSPRPRTLNALTAARSAPVLLRSGWRPRCCATSRATRRVTCTRTASFCTSSSRAGSRGAT